MARNFEKNDTVLLLHTKTMIMGRVLDVRRDHLGGSRTDSACHAVSSWQATWQTLVGRVRDELLVAFCDGTTTWIDSDKVKLFRDSV